MNSVANRDANIAKPTGLNPYAESDPISRLVQAEVRAAVSALVAMPGLRRASGDKGTIERRFIVKPGSSSLKYDQLRYSFPEQFAVEWDIAQPTSAVQVASRDYPYDDYLQDYDRDEFRLCASSQLPANYSDADVFPAIFRGLRINKFNQIKRDNKDLFFCRLEKPFRQCLLKASADQKFFYLEANDKARAAYTACESAHHLTPTEKAFYPAVMFGDEADARLVNTSQAQRTSGAAYQFEDYLKFYDHFTARQSLMNPVGMLKFRDQSRDILFYVRLNLDFRDCIGVPVVAHDALAKVGIKVYRDLEHQYDFCKDGVWNQASLRREGALSAEERYFYETIILGRHLGAYQGL